MNKVILHGIITKDATVRKIQTGEKDLLNFTLAVASSRKSKDKTGYETDFVRCMYSVKSGSRIADYLTKGSSVLIEGTIYPSSYKDKEGKKIHTTQIVVSRLELMGSGSGINVAVVSGHLGQDAEVRTAGEYKVLQMNVAARRPYKNKEGKYDADFIRVSYVRKNLGKLDEYLTKGTAVSISGTIHAGSYKKDGEWKEFFEVSAQNVRLANKKENSDSTPNSSDSSDDGISIYGNMDYPSGYEELDEDDGEVPF